HLLTVLRYVERNALRAELVKRAENWPWSSLRRWLEPELWPFLDPGPVSRPADWLERVNRVETEAELTCLRRRRQPRHAVWHGLLDAGNSRAHGSGSDLAAVGPAAQVHAKTDQHAFLKRLYDVPFPSPGHKRHSY